MKEHLLERYCAACRLAYTSVNRGETFDILTGSKVNYSAHPFLEEQLSIILGMPPREVSEQLKPRILSVQRSGNHNVLNLRTIATPSSELLPQTLTNEDLIKIAIYYNVIDQVNSEGGLVTPEKAIFTVKNELEIPDDFMPSGIMDLVEGRPVRDFQSVLANLNPSFCSEILFPVFRFSDSGPVGIDAIVPEIKPFSNATSLMYSSVRTALSAALDQFKTSESFELFSLGRIFRSVRFTAEKRKSRELKRPLFDDEKISILKSTGILDLSGAIPKIRDEISVQEIVQMSEEYEAGNHKIATTWKHETSILPKLD